MENETVIAEIDFSEISDEEGKTKLVNTFEKLPSFFKWTNNFVVLLKFESIDSAQELLNLLKEKIDTKTDYNAYFC